MIATKRFLIPFLSRAAFCFFAFSLLMGCVKTDPIAERARLKPLRLEAQAGNERAFKKLEAEALRGVPEAANQMGTYYYSKYIDLLENDREGDFFSSDKYPLYKKALASWERAAAQGNAPAAYNLGLQYEYRLYFPIREKMQVSDVAAARWYRQAAQLGDPAAMIKLWNIFYRNAANAQVAKRPGPHAVGPSEGYKWLLLAAEYGEPEAMTWLSGITSDVDENGKKFSAEDGFFWKQVLITYYSEQNGWSQPDDTKYKLSPEQVSSIKARVRAWKPYPVIWPRISKKTK